MPSQAALASSFPWPAPSGARIVRWTGVGFEVDGQPHPVLRFAVGDSGWTNALDDLHDASGRGDHPIDVASRSRAAASVRAHAPPGAIIVEIGCSAGHMLRTLREAVPDALVVGADYVGGSLERIARDLPGTPLLQFDLTRCPLASASVDVVVALNVLEHVEDDGRAVAEMLRILRPGGAAVIEVPAGPWLYDVYDRELMHHRRYTLRGLVALFRDAGFLVRDTSHVGFFVFPAFAAVKLKNRALLERADADPTALVGESIRSTRASGAFGAVMRAESALARFVRYPFGIRCVLTATRPTSRASRSCS